MSEFLLYFDLGFDHIMDFGGYDHMLFVIALSVVYGLGDWRTLLVLVTAFTVGHSITLALATLGVVGYRTEVVEFLIPLTILLTAIGNLFRKDRYLRYSSTWKYYIITLSFGLIHGLGFSNYLRALLGKDVGIVKQLLAFNLGLEIGQIAIVITFLIISFIAVNIFGIAKRDWRLIISSAIAGVAMMLLLEAKFW